MKKVSYLLIIGVLFLVLGSFLLVSSVQLNKDLFVNVLRINGEMVNRNIAAEEIVWLKVAGYLSLIVGLFIEVYGIYLNEKA